MQLAKRSGWKCCWKEFNEEVNINMLVDNKSTINFPNHPMSNGMRNYIERKYHFLRDQICKDRLKIEYCKNDYNLQIF